MNMASPSQALAMATMPPTLGEKLAMASTFGDNFKVPTLDTFNVFGDKSKVALAFGPFHLEHFGRSIKNGAIVKLAGTLKYVTHIKDRMPSTTRLLAQRATQSLPVIKAAKMVDALRSYEGIWVQAAAAVAGVLIAEGVRFIRNRPDPKAREVAAQKAVARLHEHTIQEQKAAIRFLSAALLKAAKNNRSLQEKVASPAEENNSFGTPNVAMNAMLARQSEEIRLLRRVQHEVEAFMDKGNLTMEEAFQAFFEDVDTNPAVLPWDNDHDMDAVEDPASDPGSFHSAVSHHSEAVEDEDEDDYDEEYDEREVWLGRQREVNRARYGFSASETIVWGDDEVDEDVEVGNNEEEDFPSPIVAEGASNNIVSSNRSGSPLKRKEMEEDEDEDEVVEASPKRLCI